MKLTDYQIKSSVAKHNRAMNKCRKIATEIQTNYPELKESFADLLNKEPEMSLLVAHHIIEVMQYPDNIKSKALSIIKEKLLPNLNDEEIEEKLKEYEQEIDNIRKKYRNPSAHPKQLQKIDAKECFDLVLDFDSLKLLSKKIL